MKRIDFIENRIDVVKNIYTLYSYIKSESEEEKKWALQRFKQGKWYVVEIFGNSLLFAPSRFVGYKNNTIEKHTVNHGDGTETNNYFRNLKLYKESTDEYLSTEFKKFMNALGIEKDTANFFIPYKLEISDLRSLHKCYFICPTHCQGQKENAWKSFLSKNIMAIGWKDTDYTNYTIEELKQDYIDDSTAIGPFTLIKQINEGDIICCTNNSYGLWGIGIAMSSYRYEQNIHYAGVDKNRNKSYYSHYIDVAWLCTNKQGYIPTSKLMIRPPEKQWQPYGTLTQKEEIPQYISNYILRNTNQEMEQHSKYDKYINLLKANMNLILTGAPGTGKSYLAKAIAEEMGAAYEFVQFHPSYDYTDFVEGLRPTPPDKNGNIGFERKDGIFKTFCKKAIQTLQEPISVFQDEEIRKAILQFKQEMDGQTIPSIKSESTFGVEIKDDNIFIRPTKYLNKTDIEPYTISLNNVVTYIKDPNKEKKSYESAIANYILKHFLQEENTGTPRIYVFIIDEINRGEISKIFGELFFSIDAGYRGKKVLVKTQYQNMITDESDLFYEGFYVPENVYIIGTMNDIDRSVESMDFAMRRRFGWEEIKTNENTGMLDELGSLKDEVIAKMNRLNTAIWNEETNEGIEGLSVAYHIGGAYFKKLSVYLNEEYNNVEEAYKYLWNNHIRGVLFEYLRGTINAMENLKILEEVYYGQDGNDRVEG